MLEYMYNEADRVEARDCSGVAVVVPDQSTAMFARQKIV